MVRQGGRRLLQRIGRNGLTIASAFRVRAAAVYLKVWIWLLAAEYGTRPLRYTRTDYRLAALIRDRMGLRIWRVQEGLTLLQVLDLPSSVLRSHESAVLASDLVAL